MDKNLKTWPASIFLQVDDDAIDDDKLPVYNEVSETSWCSCRVFPLDVEYIRADRATTLSTWVSVKDALPEPEITEYSQWVLCCTNTGDYVIASYYYKGYKTGWIQKYTATEWEVTHWHPLPAPPAPAQCAGSDCLTCQKEGGANA